MSLVLLAIPVLPLAAGLLALLPGREVQPVVRCLPLLAIVGSLLCSVWVLIYILGGGMLEQQGLQWLALGHITFSFALWVDRLSALMLLMVTGSSSLVQLFALVANRQEYSTRLLALLSLSTFCMLVLVLADTVLQFVVGWALLGVCSLLLLSLYGSTPVAVAAGKKAFFVHRVGDMSLLLALLLLFALCGNLQFQDMLSQGQVLASARWSWGGLSLPLIHCIGLLLLVPALASSGQLPLNVWLSQAMHGSTPVGVLLATVTMAPAGVFLLLRFSPILALSPITLNVMLLLAAGSCFAAAITALLQTKLQQILASVLICQYSYMFLACGVGALGAALLHLLTQTVTLMLLLLVFATTGPAWAQNQDIRHLSGLKSCSSFLFWLAVLGLLSLAGIPGFSGFFSRDAILLRCFASPLATGTWAWALAIVGGFLVALSCFRLLLQLVSGTSRGKVSLAPEAVVIPAPLKGALLFFAIPALGIGWLGVPTVFGGYPSWWQRTFFPLESGLGEAYPATVQILLTAATASSALGGLGMAFFLYRLQPAIPRTLAQTLARLTGHLPQAPLTEACFRIVLVQPLLFVSRQLVGKIVEQRMFQGGCDLLAQGVWNLSLRLQKLHRRPGILLWMGGALVLVLAGFLVLQGSHALSR